MSILTNLFPVYNAQENYFLLTGRIMEIKVEIMCKGNLVRTLYTLIGGLAG